MASEGFPRSEGSELSAAIPDAAVQPRLRVVVTGATGLVGTALVSALVAAGHRVDRVSRRSPRPGTTDIQWDPSRGELDARLLEGANAVVHLAGESVAAGRWTARAKDRIRRSRVESTRLLAETLARLARRPQVLVAASGVGYYGNRGEEPLTEDSPPGTGFLADLAGAWEAAADPARAAGIRVVHLRLGVVLAGHGGALPRMVVPFRLGLGGVVGDGRQYWSWIALADVVRVIEIVIGLERLAGPVNVVAPTPVTNREFTRALGRVLGRPTLVPLPAVAVRTLFGEMGQALLLDSARALPRRLERAGFKFQHRDVEGALRAALGRG
jgi:uncharacterized protein (TIGR01777 family)